jgi:hypothetical protein
MGVNFVSHIKGITLKVLQNRVLRVIFEPKRKWQEGGEDCTRTPLNIIRVNNSRRMRWAGHAACMGEIKMHTKFWTENLKGEDYLEDLGLDEMMLKWILGK